MKKSILSILIVISGVFSQSAIAEKKNMHNEIYAPVMICKETSMVSPGTLNWDVTLPSFSSVGYQVRLVVEARVDVPGSGSNPWLTVKVNNSSMTKKELLNKKIEFKFMEKYNLSWAIGSEYWRVVIAPDFKKYLDPNNKEYEKKSDPYRFVFDITPYAKAGKNKITLIQRLCYPNKPETLYYKNIKIEISRNMMESPIVEKVKPAPQGLLKKYNFSKKSKMPIKACISVNGSLKVLFAGQEFFLHTRTSLKHGKWHKTAFLSKNMRIATPGQKAKATWETKQYIIKRTVTLCDDHLHVADQIQNTTNYLIGIITEHWFNLQNKPTKLFLAGHETTSKSIYFNSPVYPSVYAQIGKNGIGIIAEDDIFREHIKSFRKNNRIGIADEMLGIAPGNTVTLEWSIYPMRNSNHWDFINAVRNNWGVNITIPGPVLFTHFFDKNGQKRSPEWLKKRGIKIAINGYTPNYRQTSSHPTVALHGTDNLYQPKEWINEMTEYAKILRKEIKNIKLCSYFTGQICSEENSIPKYKDSILYNESGKQCFYGTKYYPIYIPTMNNSYGKALWKVVKLFVEKIDVGLYWDEMCGSGGAYAYNIAWDGCSVKINKKTHAVEKKISSVQLLMQPFQVAVIKYLRSKGKILIANTHAPTRTMTQQKCIRFTEVIGLPRLIRGQLDTPVGLGNYMVERTQADAALMTRKFLKYGCLYYTCHFYYKDEMPEWNFIEYLYPTTPIYIFEDIIFAKERIITAKSGIFSLSDGEQAKVFIVKPNGDRIKDGIMSKQIIKNGKASYEIRMPSDHFAIIVHKAYLPKSI